jgi:hypothetical protein
VKKVLLSAKVPFYKVNLHCHTTVSDGKLTPLEIKEYYKSNGYSAVCFSDHEVLVDHGDLTDGSFIALKGYEISTNESDGSWGWSHTTKSAHFNLLCKTPDVDKQVCYNPYAVWGGAASYKDKVKYLGNICMRVHSDMGLNYIIRQANENGFLVTYNHPAWSLHTYGDYKNLDGLFAVEVYNSGSVMSGLLESDAVYDDFLSQGKRLHCVAADDNHNHGSADDPLNASFNGWVCVQAKEFSYNGLIDALTDGAFYSSTGPQIEELYADDNGLRIKTSPARQIIFIGRGRNRQVFAPPIGQAIREAVCNLKDEYLRAVVIDEYGKKAFTNAYRFDKA